MFLKVPRSETGKAWHKLSSVCAKCSMGPLTSNTNVQFLIFITPFNTDNKYFSNPQYNSYWCLLDTVCLHPMKLSPLLEHLVFLPLHSCWISSTHFSQLWHPSTENDFHEPIIEWLTLSFSDKKTLAFKRRGKVKSHQNNVISCVKCCSHKSLRFESLDRSWPSFLISICIISGYMTQTFL